MEHRKLLGIPGCQSIHQIESEIETVRVLELDGNRCPFFIFFHVNEIMPDPFAVIDGHRRLFFLDDRLLRKLRDRFSGRIQDDRVKDAVLPAHCDHAVRRAAVIINTVPGSQDLAVLADLYLQASLQYDIALLTVMLGQVDRTVLRGFVINAAHIQRLCDPVLERVGQVVIGHAMRTGDLLPSAGPGQGIGPKVRTVAFQDIRDGYLQGQ